MRLVAIWALTLSIIWAVSPASARQGDLQGTAVISSPADGQQLFGLAQIMGTATAASDFAGYTLDFSNAQIQEEIWLPIQPRLNQQVTEGVLGQWDTVSAGVSDGVYHIRLQVFLADGTVFESRVSNLTLTNTTPTSVPTFQPAQPLPTLPQEEASGLIDQPPTLTPVPDLAGPVLPMDEGGPSEESTFINYGAVQSAFCSGALMSLLLFAAIIGYLLMRTRISPLTSRLWWQIRSEFRDDRDY